VIVRYYRQLAWPDEAGRGNPRTCSMVRHGCRYEERGALAVLQEKRLTRSCSRDGVETGAASYARYGGLRGSRGRGRECWEKERGGKGTSS
jgi:hypothetical protein